MNNIFLKIFLSQLILLIVTHILSELSDSSSRNYDIAVWLQLSLIIIEVLIFIWILLP